jgi:Fe-S-cluster containining protein
LVRDSYEEHTSKKFSKQLRNSPRESYPDDEAKHPRLSALLDMYHAVDIGISIELEEERNKHRSALACHKGCGNCCLRPNVPVTSLELSGILWYATEKLKGEIREQVKQQLVHHTQSPQCPFLVNSLCSIYPLRPNACRIIFTFGEPCKPGEKLNLIRPEDTWAFSKGNLVRRVVMTMLPFYGITGKRKKIDALDNGYIASISTPMYEFSWEELYHNMERPPVSSMPG